jgi:predicted small lipoprotein YifL
MNRFALALVFAAAACGPAAPFELPPLGKLPEKKPPVVPVKPKQPAPAIVDTGGGLPCDVRVVLEAHCASCHGGQLYVRRLTRLEEFRYETYAGNTVGQEMVERLTTDSRMVMPPDEATTRPTPAESLVLINWVTSGMPEGGCGEVWAPH